MGTDRRAPAISAAVLLTLAVVLTLIFTPLDVLPGAEPVIDVSRDFTAEQVDREVSYHDAVRPAAYASLLLSLVVAGFLGLTRWGAAIVARCGPRWWVQVPVATLAVTAIGRLVTLPLGLRVWDVRRDTGLSNRSLGGYLYDQTLTVLVTAALSSVALLAVIAIARTAPRTWWAWGAGAMAGIVATGSFLYPVVIEPVFNDFRSLPAGELRDDLLALAEREGVPADDVLVSDASVRTSELNAYVSGFGSSRRIVLYDNLLETAPPEEIEVVVAHELGHAAEDDVLHGTLIGMAGGAGAVCVLALLLGWPALLRRAGAEGPGDPRVVPLVLFLVAAGTLLSAPAVNWTSRQIEQRADLRALETTQDPEAFIASFRRLATTNLSDLDPNPIAHFWFASHDSAPQRIAFARAWAAQQEPQGDGS